MKVCEVCGQKEQEENEEEFQRKVLFVCESCRSDRRSETLEEN